MRKVSVEKAIGLTLCHDITGMFDGFKGPLFRRGHVIAPEDLPMLERIGKKHIYIWEPQSGEVHEEDAARRLAALSPVPYVSASEPSEGKITVRALTDGMFLVNRELLRQVNAIPDLTVCTLPSHSPVRSGDALASMRIVPLTTQEENLLRAEKVCGGEPLYRLVPYVRQNVSVIITGSEVYHGVIQDKFEPVARKKLADYPCTIGNVAFCDDDKDQLAAMIRDEQRSGADIILISGGMSVDPDDVTPSAVADSGARVVTYGVPSQPGNMTLVAYLENTAVVGVPGAAISQPVTVLDALLPQLFAKIPFTREELLTLAEGGLCRHCPTCHFPNCTFGKY